MNKLKFISANALRQILVSVFGMAIPFMVIHFSSKETWGAFVSPLLFSLLALQVINWGNKEYLLRQFSMQPNAIIADFSQNLFTRLPLLLLSVIVAFFYFPTYFFLWIFVWFSGRFLVHSAEALIIYEKKFDAAVAIELGSFTIFCIGFYFFKNQLDLVCLLILYSVYQLLKGVAYIFVFRNFVYFKHLKIDLNYYVVALPFFLLAVLGFLASKVDVYLVETLGNKKMTADYQIINSLLVLTMSISAFIYSPFTKNIYRNSADVIIKTKKILALSGLFIVPVAIAVIYLILKYYLKLQLPLTFYFVAFLYAFPSFVYGIEVVNLFRHKKEKTVVAYLFFGSAINALLSAAFLYCGYGITGALFGAAIAQVVVMFLFKSKIHAEK